ncbi:hypothetical protein TRIUR3_04895 [Triticum urartu]|uniref:F-box domain-containing protein n=1 Tax=Triticum urartu TaxID=4572 RepID=M7YHL9_TRIUA|nr:hypothetical protein TRIUR3_04895 [Triticum urartu]
MDMEDSSPCSSSSSPAPAADFVDYLGPDTSVTVFTMLHHPADLARASAVSRSWRQFVIDNQFSKLQCLRACPEVSTFTQVDVTTTTSRTLARRDQDTATSADDKLHRDHRVYMHLSHGLLTPYKPRDCIIHCIGASSTDNFPDETIENTLESVDHLESNRPSYWSSGGQRDPATAECLIYRLQADLCLIQEIKLQPFKGLLSLHPPFFLYIWLLAYSALLRCRDARLAYQIHAQACRRGLAASNPVLACSLLAFYSAARSDLPAAARLFDEMPRRDAVAYTAMMSAFIRAGDWAQALALYPRMLAAGAAPPTEHTFANLLALCASRRLCCHGRQLHAQLLRWGADLNLVLKTALLHMYSSCGFMDHAHAVLCSTPDTDVVLWTAMIAGYSRAGDLQAALRMFRRMEHAGVLPSAFTFSGIITACASSSSAQPQASQIETGRQLHARVFKFALAHDISVCNALVDLYSKSSACLLDLLHAFSATDSPNVVSWTALIAGLARHGRDKDAFAAFAEMRASEAAK